MKLLFKLRKYAPFIYVVLLVSFGLYVRNVVANDDLKVKKRDADEQGRDVKPAKVFLEVSGPFGTENYEARMQNVNTVNDFLELMREEQGLAYEVTEYSFGARYDEVNGIVAPENYTWRVFENDADITFSTFGRELIDKAQYKLVLLEDE